MPESSRTTELEQTLLALELRLMHYRKADFEKILAEDFTEFGTSGTVYDRASMLDSFVGDAGVPEPPFDVRDFHVRELAPGLAHATYVTEARSDGAKSLRSSLWRHGGSGWQLYFHQGTRTK